MSRWLLIFFLPSPLFAEEIDLSSCSTFVAQSKHYGLEEEYNENHWHIQCEEGKPLLIGAYYNSEKNVSLYIGKKLSQKNIEWEYGLATGYKAFPVIPYGRVKIKEIFIAPAFEENDKGDWNYGFVIGVEKQLW